MDWSISCMWLGEGVQVVAQVPEPRVVVYRCSPGYPPHDVPVLATL